MTASNTVFAVFSGLGVVLSLIPLWWHLKSPIIGTSMFMVWTALACLVYLVNSIVWSGNTINRAPIWCDIAIRVQIGAGVAFPACSFCIVRRLYWITCAPTAQIGKHRGATVDLLITIGIPVLQMVAQYTVATHRFKIIEDFGCSSTARAIPIVYPFVFCWSLIIGVVSAFYGALTIRAFMKRRKQSKDIRANSDPSHDRYWRLIALSSADLCITIPLSIKSIVSDSISGFHPLASWADIHRDYSQIIQVPRSALDTEAIVSYEIARWTPILCAFLCFGIFGFTKESRRNYRLLVSTIAQFFGLTIPTGSVSTPGSHSTDHSLHFAPPVPVTLQTASRTDSDSLSDDFPTEVNKFDLGDQSHSTAGHRASTNSTSLSINELPRIPEPILDPTLVKMPLVHPGNAFD